jgi:hypothetical protein
MIQTIGRLDLGTGPLTNATSGGDGGEYSKKSIEKIRAYNIGKKLSEETK